MADEAKTAEEGKQPKVERIKQNGQVFPREGTVSAKLWAMFDAASNHKGEPAKLSEVMDEALAAGIKEASARSGYAHWRKFHGLVTPRAPKADADQPTPDPSAPVDAEPA